MSAKCILAEIWHKIIDYNAFDHRRQTSAIYCMKNRLKIADAVLQKIEKENNRITYSAQNQKILNFT